MSELNILVYRKYKEKFIKLEWGFCVNLVDNKEKN